MKIKHTVKVISLLSIIILTFIMAMASAYAATEISVGDINLGSSSMDRDESHTYDVTITNTGTNNLTNLNVNIADNLNIIDVEYPGGLPSTLSVGSTYVARLTYTIPLTKDSEIETIGSLTATGNYNSETATASKDITLEAKSYLRFDDITIYINGEEETDLEVRDGDDVRIVIELENTYHDDDNIQIENAFVEIDSDNDWDFADGEESNERDIDEDDKETFEIEFTIDEDDIDDEDITMTLIAKGDDEDNSFEHYDEDTLRFEFSNPQDELRINDVVFSANPIDCSEEFVYVDVEIENTGSNDQDQVMITLRSNEYSLDWEDKVVGLNLDEDDTYTHQFKVPLKQLTKNQYMSFEVYNDDWDSTDYVGVILSVVCNNPVVDDNEEDEEQPEEYSEYEPVQELAPGELHYEEPVAGNVFSGFWNWFTNLFK